MPIRIISLLIIVLFSILPSFAIEEIEKGDVLTLQECIDIALRNSPQIKKAKANIRISKAQLGQSKAVWTPYIGAGTSFNGSNSWRDKRSSNNRYFGADAMISQLIYDFGKTNSSINIQKFNTMASEFELDYVTLETILAVKEAYMSVLAAGANKDVQVQNVEINERQYNQIKSYYEEGIKSRIDFVNAQVNLSNAKYDLLSAQDRYCDAMVSLNKSMYVINPPDYSISPIERFNAANETIPVTLIHSHTTSHDHDKLHEDEMGEITLSGIIKENEIVKGHILDDYKLGFEESVEIANQNRPDLKSYLAIKDAMKESVKLSKRQWFPEISANAGYNYQRNDGTNTNSFSYGADLSIPMVNPLNIKYGIDEATARLDSSTEDVNLLVQNIYYDVQLALCETRIYENQIPLVLDRIKLAKENFELADGRYTEGIGNYIELQDARSQYLNAQMEYINTVYQYGLSRANLDFVMGVK